MNRFSLSTVLGVAALCCATSSPAAIIGVDTNPSTPVLDTSLSVSVGVPFTVNVAYDPTDPSADPAFNILAIDAAFPGLTLLPGSTWGTLAGTGPLFVVGSRFAAVGPGSPVTNTFYVSPNAVPPGTLGDVAIFSFGGAFGGPPGLFADGVTATSLPGPVDILSLTFLATTLGTFSITPSGAMLTGGAGLLASGIPVSPAFGSATITASAPSATAFALSAAGPAALVVVNPEPGTLVIWGVGTLLGFGASRMRKIRKPS